MITPLGAYLVGWLVGGLTVGCIVWEYFRRSR